MVSTSANVLGRVGSVALDVLAPIGHRKPEFVSVEPAGQDQTPNEETPNDETANDETPNDEDTLEEELDEEE